MTSRSVCVAALMFGLVAPAWGQAPPDRVEAMMMIGGVDHVIPVPILEERLNVTIDGQHATTTLLQVYQNRTTAQIEGKYRLRPGSGAHVDGFAYWNGEQKIVGEVFERETAHAVYNRVTSRQRDPGLLEEDGEGAFTFKIFPVAPQEKKRVEVRWTKWLDRRAHTVMYRAPLGRLDTDITIELRAPVKNLRSPTHRLHSEQLPGGGVRLRSDGSKSAGEIVLEWEVDDADWSPSLFVQPGPKDQDGWFTLALAAPDLAGSKVAAKDVTIVIDRSGSMTGEPMEHAKAAAADMVRLLPPSDRVNVITFSDEVDPLFKAPQQLDAETRARVVGFVDRTHEGGGTDIALALRTAIQSQDTKPGRPRVIVFMTDGQSDVELALDAAHLDTGDVRVFTIGLGKEVNKPLLARLAAMKRGRFTYIEEAQAIEPEVRRLAESIAKPLLVGVSVDVEGAQAVRLYPRTMPDLFAQDELVVKGRVRGQGVAKFVIHGTLAGKPVAFAATADLGKASPRPWVASLWAQSRVDHLLEEIALGSTAPEMMTEVLELALAYNFVTPYTAFLAVPESELGDMRDTVMDMRAYKQEVMEKNADAAGLSGEDPIDARNFAKSAPRTVASNMPMDKDDSGDDDGAEESDEESAPVSSSARVHGHGCAGCATSDGGPGALLVLAVGLLVVRRRRTRAPR